MYCRHRIPTRQPGGQELVEFALAVPLLMTIAFGVLDLGRLYHAGIAVTNAARVGARYATFFPDDPAAIIAAAQDEAAESGINLTDPETSLIEVSCPEGCVQGEPIRVTITYEFRLVLANVMSSAVIPIYRYSEMMLP